MYAEISLIYWVAFLLTGLAGCGKTGSDPAIPESPEFSFSYNGQTYNNPAWGSVMSGSSSRMEGIAIMKPDVLGGFVYFILPNCAFLDPNGISVNRSMPGCILTSSNTGGGPIDSSQVYIYRSGAVTQSYSNCVHKKDPDLVFGGFIEYDECTVTGTFSLVLGNNMGLEKNISGSFKFIKIRR